MIRLFLSEYSNYKQQSQAGRALLDFVLKTNYETNLHEREVLYGGQGKPYFSDFPLHFNVSHSGGLVALAVSDQAIGIDIEVIRPIKRAIGVRFLGIDTDDKMELIRAWTKRESYGKMTGEGFHFQSFCEPHYFHEYFLSGRHDDYLLMVCSPLSVFPDQVERISLQLESLDTSR